jgi:hypothetical protein
MDHTTPLLQLLGFTYSAACEDDKNSTESVAVKLTPAVPLPA